MSAEVFWVRIPGWLQYALRDWNAVTPPKRHFPGSSPGQGTMNLKQFINSKWKNKWIKEGKVICYMRKSSRLYEGRLIECIDIASVTIDELTRESGHFTKFLEQVEETAKKEDRAVFIENVMTERFCNLFRRKGYNLFSNDMTSCFIKEIQ